MSIPTKSIIAIVAAAILAVNEYLHLGNELITRVFGSQPHLSAASHIVTDGAVWIFGLCLLPVLARTVVRLCDDVSRCTNRVTIWLLQRLIRLLQSAVLRLSPDL